MWHVSVMTARLAEQLDRKTYNIPEGRGLGWTPYRFRVRRGAFNHVSFHRSAELRRWMAENDLRIARVGNAYLGHRSLFLEKATRQDTTGRLFTTGPRHAQKRTR